MLGQTLSSRKNGAHVSSFNLTNQHRDLCSSFSGPQKFVLPSSSLQGPAVENRLTLCVSLPWELILDPGSSDGNGGRRTKFLKKFLWWQRTLSVTS